MKINNISNCCKPRKASNFTGNELTDNSKKPMRFKHYEQMSDDVLMAQSITKAHQAVQKSGKMQLLKAMPALTTALIGTSLAITRPGKLSAKAATGLGFLVASEALGNIFNNVSNKLEKDYLTKKVDEKPTKEKNTKKALGYILAGATAVAGAFAIAKGAKKINNEKINRATNFIKKEAQTLTDEINSTKLGKFVDEKVTPFLNKHKNAKFALELAPFGLLVAGVEAKEALSKSISKDFKKEANKNFIKGKLVQDIARKEFDKIDAEEV